MPRPHRLRALVFTRNYLPGYKGGGPIRTIANLVDRLGDEVDFSIFARDRDFGDVMPYPGVRVGEWQKVGAARVYYAGPRERRLGNLIALIRSTDYDVIYFNSAFDLYFTTKPLIAHRFVGNRKARLIIAPRGEFSLGALHIKRWIKSAHLAIAKTSRFLSGVIWQASDPLEEADIRRVIGRNAAVQIAPNLGTRHDDDATSVSRPAKSSGAIRLLFIGRISPIKNVLSAIRALGSVRGEVSLDVYGPITDPGYWADCESAIAQLPDDKHVTYHGAVERKDLPGVFRQHHALLLPSMSENYGHAIVESLSFGVPVVIGCNTPWQRLDEVRAGFVCEPTSIDELASAVQTLTDMDDEAFSSWRSGAATVGNRILAADEVVAANRALLTGANGIVGKTLPEATRANQPV